MNTTYFPDDMQFRMLDTPFDEWAKPILAQAADMSGGATMQQMLGGAAHGIEHAAGRDGHIRGEIDRAGALENRLGNVSAY